MVCLAVIFIPMILSGQGGQDAGYRGQPIPPEPSIKFPDKIVEKSAPAQPVVTPSPRVTVVEIAPELGTADEREAEAARHATLTDPEVSTPETPVAPEPTPREEAPPAPRSTHAWAVQVGSFNNKTSAFTLRDKLRAKKFAAYVESVPTAKGPVYRVRVGPELQQALAETLLARIAKETGQKGIVVNHR